VIGSVNYGREQWQKLICASDLPASARLVALSLSLYTDQSGAQGVWHSSSDIARITGLRSLNTVNIYLRKLQAAGWLYRENSAYFLAWPGQEALDLEAAEQLQAPR
jgi:hypothetical protein